MSPCTAARIFCESNSIARRVQAASDTYLALTYTTHGGGPAGRRRFDSMWASPEFTLRDFRTHYEDPLAAGTDHAMLVGDLELGPARHE